MVPVAECLPQLMQKQGVTKSRRFICLTHRVFHIYYILSRASQASLMSDASDNGTRHLALVFFDILVLDSISLLSTSYSSRRAMLESIIRIKPGYIMLAERSRIVLNGPQNIDGAGNQLRNVWARVIADGEEGLVLKADQGMYNDYRSPWVKVRDPCIFVSR
jgi:DNA ligase-4